MKDIDIYHMHSVLTTISSNNEIRKKCRSKIKPRSILNIIIVHENIVSRIPIQTSTKVQNQSSRKRLFLSRHHILPTVL